MNRNVKIVLDTGPIISLAVIDRLDIFAELFDEIFIPVAVRDELRACNHFRFHPDIASFLKNRVKKIKSLNELVLILGKGESESILLYKELNADFLVIDDKKARLIAEEFGINCIGTLALLIKAQKLGLIKKLKPVFESLIANRRFYSRAVLNSILVQLNEDVID